MQQEIFSTKPLPRPRWAQRHGRLWAVCTALGLFACAVVLALALLFLWPNLPWLVQEPGGWVLLASLAAGAAGMLVRSYYLTWNENGKRGSSRKK